MADRHEELLELLHSVNRTIFDQIKDIFERHGIPSATIAIMHQIRRDEGITVSELARRTSIVKSHVSKTVEGLVEQGLVEKRTDPADQRLIRLHTTEKALTHFGPRSNSGPQTEIRERLSTIVAAMPDEQVAALTDGLRSLKAVLDQRQGKPGPRMITGDDQA